MVSGCPRVTLLDCHCPVPTLGWTVAFEDGEGGAGKTGLPSLPGQEPCWDLCWER